VHYWIIEHDIVETRSEDYRKARDSINNQVIGVLSTTAEVKPIVVQGVKIDKPSWFSDTSLDVSQLPKLRRGRG